MWKTEGVNSPAIKYLYKILVIIKIYKLKITNFLKNYVKTNIQ